MQPRCCGASAQAECLGSSHLFSVHPRMQDSRDRRSKDEDLACEVCNVAVDSSLELGQHMRDVHLIETSYYCVCEICKRVFGSKRCLSKHKKNVHFVTTFCHANRPEDSAYLCSRCGERVSSGEFEDHEKQHTLDDETEEEGQIRHLGRWKRFGCPTCGIKFTNKSNMHRHMAKVHELDVLISAKENTDVGCPLCDNKLKRNLLDRHVKDAHGVEIDTDMLIFYSKEDFFQWKSAMEAQTLSSFVTRSSSAGKALFVCHRAGHSTGRWGDGKKTRRSATAKTGRWCPARITARYGLGGGAGTVWARFCKTHLGHGRSARFLRLSKAERAALASRIRRGETLDAILEDVHSSAPAESRLRALSKRDLHNIVRDFGLHSRKRGPASPTYTHPQYITVSCSPADEEEEEEGAQHTSIEDHSYCVSEVCT